MTTPIHSAPPSPRAGEAGQEELPTATGENAPDLVSEVTVASMRIRVAVKRKSLTAKWPRWNLQLLDVDGSEMQIDTLDLSLYGGAPTDEEGVKSLTLTRDALQNSNEFGTITARSTDAPAPPVDAWDDPSQPPAQPGVCHCPDCERAGYAAAAAAAAAAEASSKAYMMNAPMYGADMMMMTKRRRQDSGVKEDTWGSPDDLDRQRQMMYTPDRLLANGGSGSKSPTVVRNFGPHELAVLRQVDWPSKTKSNGLPTLWCHACYLKKGLFKIVSPLSPKPNIVYFRHQQCNTSYHKGESLPSSIVKLYQEYYLRRGSLQAAATAAEVNGLVDPSRMLLPSSVGMGGPKDKSSASPWGTAEDEKSPSSSSSAGTVASLGGQQDDEDPAPELEEEDEDLEDLDEEEEPVPIKRDTRSSHRLKAHKNGNAVGSEQSNSSVSLSALVN